MTKQKLFFLVALVLFVVLGSAVKVSAQDPGPTSPAAGIPSDNDVNRVAKKLYCPVCPNTPLDVCETQACKDWRAQIRDQMASGWTDQQVMDYFVKQYGERVLAEPERGGFASLIWMLPVLVVAVGLVIVWLLLKSWRRGQSTQQQQDTSEEPGIPKDVLAKIEAEIRKLD